MKTPVNTFKQALQNQPVQTGLWLGLVDPFALLEKFKTPEATVQND